MKKFYLLTKTLLVAVCLLMGSASAWADDYSTVYTRATVGAWTDDDKTDWNASSAVEVNATYGLGANANSAATYVNKSFTIGSNNKIKYEVDWSFATATGRTSNWNWIQFGDFFRIAVNSSYNMQVSTDAGANWNATTLGYYSNGTYTKHIELIFDTATKTVESFTFDGTDRTALVSGTFTGKSFNTVSTGFVRGGSVSWNLANYITTITVSQAAQAVVEADYTVNYKLGENVVKTVSSSSTVGAVITADVAIDGTEEGYVGKHYLITAAEAPSMTLVDGENVLDVSVRSPYTATLNVTRTIGGVAETPVVTNLTETDAKVCSWGYTYPLYVQKDGVYYVADVTSSFGESGTFTNGETINKTVAYTNPDYSVVYFGEPNESTGTNTTYSNGATGYITGGVGYADNKVIRLGTLAAGKYRLITNVTGDANRYVVVGDCSDTSVFPTALVTITTTGAKDEEFTLATATPISISGKDQGNSKFNQSSTVDYILVKAVSVPATIGTTGWTTFSSPYALNLSSMTASAGDVAAYYASATSAESVTVLPTESSAVKAGEGFLLKGTAGATITIPVVATGSEISGNLMVGCPTAASITKETANYDKCYVLGIEDEKAVFQNIKNYCDDGNTVSIPAGKAYLNATASNGARALRLSFGGITEVENVVAAEATAKKNGAYLENGKIAIYKNGMKFNANGQLIK